MSVRKAQADFFSPMTGNRFNDDRRRNNLIMEAIKTDLIKTDDPFTQIKDQKSYYTPDDPASITDAFDRDYGVLSDDDAAVILQQNIDKLEEPTPVIDPEPTPTPTPTPTPEPEVNPENTPEKAVELATKVKKSGGGNKTRQQKANIAKNKAKAKAMAKARNKAKSQSSSVGRKSHGDPGGSRAGRSSVGRGGARGGSTGGRGASSKGGVSRGGTRR